MVDHASLPSPPEDIARWYSSRHERSHTSRPPPPASLYYSLWYTITNVVVFLGAIIGTMIGACCRSLLPRCIDRSRYSIYTQVYHRFSITSATTNTSLTLYISFLIPSLYTPTHDRVHRYVMTQLKTRNAHLVDGVVVDRRHHRFRRHHAVYLIRIINPLL